MKHLGKIILAAIFVMALILGTLLYKNWDTLKAVYASRYYSAEELQQQIESNQQQVQNIMDDHPEIVVRDLTEEERAQLENGTISVDELTDALIGDMVQPSEEIEKPHESVVQMQTGSEQPPEITPEMAAAYDEALSALVAKTYILRANFESQLGQLEQSAKDAYHALPEEQRTTEALIDIVFGYYDTMVSLEAECDAEMKGILDEMRTLVEANNGDKDLPDSIWAAYEEEKALKKSWYLSELQNRGIL